MFGCLYEANKQNQNKIPEKEREVSVLYCGSKQTEPPQARNLYSPLVVITS